MNRVVSLTVLLVLIILLGGTFYRVIAPFLMPLFLAAVLAVICQPLEKYFLRRTGGRKSWAAALTTSTVTMTFVIPTIILTFIAATNFYELAEHHLGGGWAHGLDLLWHRVVMPVVERASPLIPGGLTDERLLKWKADFSENIQSVIMQLAGTTFSIASSTVSTFVSLSVGGGMFITALYYFLSDGPSMLAFLEELIPLPVDHQRKLCDRFARVVRAVVTATFIAAFAQGLATAVALQVCGFGHFVVFLIISSIAALIPIAGTWMVWGPCAVWLVMQGHWVAAVGLTIWGVAVVGIIDNVVKMYVLQSEADLHPLIGFISVIGALQVMGLWGIFVGPIVASCLFALIQIFNTELGNMAKERDAAHPASAPNPQSEVPAIASVPAGDQAIASSSGTPPGTLRRAPSRGKLARKRRH